MDSDNNYHVIYCADDDEYRTYCNIYDKLCIERCYKNNLKSGTHINNNRKKTTISNNLL